MSADGCLRNVTMSTTVAQCPDIVCGRHRLQQHCNDTAMVMTFVKMTIEVYRKPVGELSAKPS